MTEQSSQRTVISSQNLTIVAIAATTVNIGLTLTNIVLTAKVIAQSTIEPQAPFTRYGSDDLTATPAQATVFNRVLRNRADLHVIERKIDALIARPVGPTAPTTDPSTSTSMDAKLDQIIAHLNRLQTQMNQLVGPPVMGIEGRIVVQASTSDCAEVALLLGTCSPNETLWCSLQELLGIDLFHFCLTTICSINTNIVCQATVYDRLSAGESLEPFTWDEERFHPIVPPFSHENGKSLIFAVNHVQWQKKAKIAWVNADGTTGVNCTGPMDYTTPATLPLTWKPKAIVNTMSNDTKRCLDEIRTVKKDVQEVLDAVAHVFSVESKCEQLLGEFGIVVQSTVQGNEMRRRILAGERFRPFRLESRMYHQLVPPSDPFGPERAIIVATSPGSYDTPPMALVIFEDGQMFTYWYRLPNAGPRVNSDLAIPWMSTAEPPSSTGTSNGQGLWMRQIQAIYQMALSTTPQLGAPQVVVQASLKPDQTTDLKVADVEQIIEAPTDRQATENIKAPADTLDNWNIKDVMSRPVLIGRGSWNPSTQIGANLLQTAAAEPIAFPQQWLRNQEHNDHFRTLLRMFNMSKMDIVFRLVANATPMYGGIVALYFDFFGRLTRLQPDGFSTTQISNFDPVYLDLSKGTTAELKIPFSAVSQYITVHHRPFAAEFLGNVFASTMSLLAKPDTGANVDLRLYAYLEGVDVALLQRPTSTQEEGNYIVPQASIVKSITSFAHSYLPGMKDPYPLAMEESYKIPRSNSCRTEQVASTFGLINSFTWTTNDDFNAMLADVLVSPMVHTRNGNNITAPKLAHIGRHFCYWNGSLEYRIQIACSDLHTGKLLVVFHPGSSPSSRTTTSSNPHMLIDVKQAHEISFVVPFISPTAWKPTYIANPFSDLEACSTGRITIHSADSIRSALQEVSNVTVNVFIRATPSFQYSVPRNGLLGARRVGDVVTQESFLTSVVPNNKMNSEDFNDLYKVMRRYVPLGGAINVPATAQNVASSQVIIPVTPILGNLVNNNAISLLSSGFAFWRGSLKYKIKVIGTGATAFEVIHHPTMGLPAGRGENYFRIAPQQQTVDAGAFCGSQTFHAEIDKEWEIVVPYYSMYDWLHLPLVNYGSTTNTLARKLPLLSTNNGCIILRPLFTNLPYSVTVTYSIGEDFTLAGPTAFPQIPVPAETVIPSNVQIVVQGAVDPQYPSYLRNPLFRSAWDALPLTSKARSSRSQFNKHYYKYCAECNCNVFSYLHSERCRPISFKEEVKEVVHLEPQMLSGMTEFFSKLNQTNNIVNEIVTDLKEKKTEVEQTGTVQWLIDTITKFIQQAASQASTAVRNWVSQMLPEVDWKLFVSSIAAAYVLYSVRDVLDTFTGQLVIGGLSALVSHKFLTYSVDYIKEYLGIPIRVQEGSGFNFSTIAQLCCGVLTYFLTLGSKGSATRLLKSAGDLGRSLSGIKSGVDALNIFTAFLQEKMIPELSSSEGKVLHSMMANSLDILSNVDALNLEEMKVRCFTEAEIKEKVLRTYDDLIKLHRTALAGNASSNIMSALNNSVRKMEKLRSEVVAFKGNERYRVDPFHISLYGAPGCGKSACMNQIAEDMRAIHDWPTDNLLYTRLTDTEYWDGYLGQTIVIYDDLAQVVSEAPNDITEMIGIKSNSPYIVHMASLQDKGRYFTSKMLISSTNMKSVRNYPGLRDPNSFHRRRNALVEMRRETDAGQPRVFGGGPNGQDHARFRFLDAMTTEPTSEWMTYEEVMPIIIEQSEVYYAEQRALVAKNGEGIRPSTVAQAILDSRLPTEIPGVVEPGTGEFIVEDLEVQALLDQSPADFVRAQKKMWTDAYNAAFARRDFAMMTGCFNYFQKTQIVEAMSTGCKDGLSRAQRAVLRQHNIHDRLKSSWYNIVANTQERTERVTSYFSNLWKEMPEERRRYLSTALVGIGAVGVAAALAFYYSKQDGKDRATNEINTAVFSEGEVYTSNKDRSSPTLKVEGEAEFLEWAEANPGIIPYRFNIDNSGWIPKLGSETEMWKDYDAYCTKVGHPNRYTLPDFKKVLVESGIDDYRTKRVQNRVFKTESGIDDYKTRKIATRTFKMEGVVPEATFLSPMSLDVSPEIARMTSEELLAEMKTTVDEMPEVVTAVKTMNMEYTVAGSPQIANDPDAYNFAANTLLDNLALVWQPRSSIRMKAVVVDDRFIAMPKHFFTAAPWSDGDEFRIRLREKSYPQSFDRTRLHFIRDRDIAIYLLSARVTGARSIMSRIAAKEDHGKFKTTTGNLVALATNDKAAVFVKYRVLPSIHAMTTADSKVCVYPLGEEEHYLRGYRYFADTVNGECGSILIQDNKNTPAKILGFHVAAAAPRQNAFSEMLVREEIQQGIDFLVNSLKYLSSGTSQTSLELLQRHEICVQSGVSSFFGQLHERIDIVGALDKQLVKRAPGKTDIVPSILQGVVDLKPLTEPAILSHTDPRITTPGFDPLVSAVSKYGQDCAPFNNQHIKMYVEHSINKYRKFEGAVGRRVLSLKESINGIPGSDHLDAVNMNSAEGAFWNFERPIFEHNKKWMFERYEDASGQECWKIAHKPLLAKLLHRIKEAQAGRRVMSVSNECLKDERRGLNKIYCEKPGTRSFSILPVDYNLAVRMYFLDFAVMIMKNRGVLSSQCGINPCSIEWTALMMRLRSMSELGFAGDFKNFDGQECAELMDAQCDVINAWYDDGPVNAQVRKVLMGEAYDRLTIVHNGIIHIDQGLPSGFPLTVIVNGMNNDAYKYLAWLNLAPAPMKRLTCCDENVDSIVYGDDNGHAVKPKVLEFFNMQTFGEFLAKHGITLTDEHKNPWQTAAPYVDIKSISFLKRLFVPHPDYPAVYRAPLEKKSIEDRVLWTTKSKFLDSDELLAENIKNSMQDAYQWGRLYFHELYEKLYAGLKEVGKEHLMANTSYTAEDYAFISTIKGIESDANPLCRQIFGI